MRVASFWGSSSASSTASSSNYSSSSSGGGDEARHKKKQRQVKHPRRYCRLDGCTRIVKSQGLCHRHGAKTRFCKVSGCEKQAQGSLNGMCKAHFNEYGAVEQAASANLPTGEKPSVYETIIPDSVSWNPATSPFPVPPLIPYLQSGSKMPAGWHRNDERMKRGLQPIVHQQQLEIALDSWEQDLAFTEIVVVSGRPDTAQSLSHLAHAWGRKRDFHVSLLSLVCHRQRRLPHQLSLPGRTQQESAVAVSSSQEPSISPNQNFPVDGAAPFLTERFLVSRNTAFTSDAAAVPGLLSGSNEGRLDQDSSVPESVLQEWRSDSSTGEFDLEPFTYNGFANV